MMFMKLNKAEEKILNLLLDRYENSKEVKEQRKSSRRIMINFYGNKNRFEPYNIEDFESKFAYESAVKELKKREWINFEWVKGQENHIIAKVWLNIESIDEIYLELSRQPKGEYINNILLMLTEAEAKATVQWVKQCFRDWISYIEKNKKNIKILPNEISQINEFLECIIFVSKIGRHEILERVLSIKCFGNSKKFERVYKSKLVGVIKTFFLENTLEMSEEDVLKCIGVVRYPEQIEFCGNIGFKFSEKWVDYSPLTFGGCINVIDAINSKILLDRCVEKVIFIENKANYVDYIINHRVENELVVFHGGYYSPSKGLFYENLKNALTNQVLYHWSDIDFGGFDMFSRLKKNIFKGLKSYKMGIEELKKYENFSTKIDDEYASKLCSLIERNELVDEYKCLEYMIENRIKLEQEAMI